MGESAKAVTAIVLIICLFGGAFAWLDGPPPWGWGWRIGFTLGTIASLAVLLGSMRRRDRAPDFLAAVARAYFERAGFCFAIAPGVAEGVCVLNVYFQNRYERPCRAQIVIQPASGFWLTRSKIQSQTVEIECEGGAFGLTQVPWPVPGKYQGTKQSFDVGAYVEFRDGRGKMLRFRDGVAVGNATVDAWKGAATLIGAAGGMIVMSRPAKLTVKLPESVAEEVADEAPIVTKTLWRPGDPSQTMPL